MQFVTDERREPKLIAYIIAGVLAAIATWIANYLLGWHTPWYIYPLCVIAGLYGVVMMESGCEAVVVIILASIPLAVVLWINADYSLWKQLWVSAIAGNGAGKIWVGMIR